MRGYRATMTRAVARRRIAHSLIDLVVIVISADRAVTDVDGQARNAIHLLF